MCSIECTIFLFQPRVYKRICFLCYLKQHLILSLLIFLSFWQYYVLIFISLKIEQLSTYMVGHLYFFCHLPFYCLSSFFSNGVNVFNLYHIFTWILVINLDNCSSLSFISELCICCLLSHWGFPPLFFRTVLLKYNLW